MTRLICKIEGLWCAAKRLPSLIFLWDFFFFPNVLSVRLMDCSRHISTCSISLRVLSWLLPQDLWQFGNLLLVSSSQLGLKWWFLLLLFVQRWGPDENQTPTITEFGINPSNWNEWRTRSRYKRPKHLQDNLSIDPRSHLIDSCESNRGRWKVTNLRSIFLFHNQKCSSFQSFFGE